MIIIIYAKSVIFDLFTILSTNLRLIYVTSIDSSNYLYNYISLRFNRLLLIQPSNDKAYFQIGLIHSELGDIESAKKAFQKALYITPTYRTALYNFAFLSYQTKEVEKAFNALLTLKQHHPDHSNGMQLLGDCYMQFEQLEEAIETYKLSIHYNPNHVTAIHNLGEFIKICVYIYTYIPMNIFLYSLYQ